MIASFTPGRIRLRFKELKNPSIVEQVRDKIKNIPGITTIEIKPLTGSILIEYDTKTLPTEKLLEMGREELAKVNIEIEIPKLP
ncbi:MAG: ATPase P [Treponema sp.]|jgi:copper chaperone CopZ|nr:ATPase P [Treponema sp.]